MPNADTYRIPSTVGHDVRARAYRAVLRSAGPFAYASGGKYLTRNDVSNVLYTIIDDGWVRQDVVAAIFAGCEGNTINAYAGDERMRDIFRADRRPDLYV